MLFYFYLPYNFYKIWNIVSDSITRLISRVNWNFRKELLLSLWGRKEFSKLPLFFFHLSIYLKFGKFHNIVVRWFIWVWIKIPERSPFLLVTGEGNLKIIFIYWTIFLKFVTWFLTVIARWFNLSWHTYFHFCWMRWKVTQTGPGRVPDGEEGRGWGAGPPNEIIELGLYCETTRFLKIFFFSSKI